MGERCRRTVCLVGAGMGNPRLLTQQAREWVDNAHCLVGSARMLEPFSDFPGETLCSVSSGEILAFLERRPQLARTAVLVSGDVGFYSAARRLTALLEEAGFEVELCCGVSSLQYLCAKGKTAWEDAAVLSLHGREGDLVGLARVSRKLFVLTGGACTAREVCRQLAQNGLGALSVLVGENLSYPQERLVQGTAAELAEGEFAPLSAVLIQNPHPQPAQPCFAGLEDESFLRSGPGERAVPMTKSEVRAVSIAKLRVRAGDVLYDIGAGTGSVAVELARMAHRGTVYAVEHNPQAVRLLRENRERFGLVNLHILQGSAPEALRQLPAPDRVFIGGSSGRMAELFALLLEKNPSVRLVVNAVTLETLGQALGCFERFGLIDTQILQLSVSKSREVGGYHMMLGHNPVYILAGEGRGAGPAPEEERHG